MHISKKKTHTYAKPVASNSNGATGVAGRL